MQPAYRRRQAFDQGVNIEICYFVPSQQILGHEFSGTVVEVGSELKDYREGDRVAINNVCDCLIQILP